MLKKMMLMGLFSLSFSGFSFLYIYFFSDPDDRAPASTQQSPYAAHQAKVASKQLMEQARVAHDLRDYKIANYALSKLLEQYPSTGYMEEASCLLAKGLYYEKELDKSEKVIKRLQEYDPNLRSECMGDALLTLARIHQKKEQIDSAIHLYRKVITEFSNHEALVDEAEDLLLKISL